MRVLILSPHALDSDTGNAVTLRRLIRHLSRRGVIAIVEPISESDGLGKLEDAIWRFKPDLIHCYHSYKTGRLVAALRSPPVPVVASVTGTDMNSDFGDPTRRAPITEVLTLARLILAGSPSLQKQVEERFHELSAKVRLIPKGVDLADKGYGLRSRLDIGPEDFIFFLPGGVRPVKNTLFSLRPVAALRTRFRKLHWVVAGAILDDSYGREFQSMLKTRPWVKHIESIPHENMLAAYRACEVTLNTSVSEGLANTVLEAMWAGRAVLASDIPGNRDAVDDGVTGLLYRNEDEFADRATRLITDEGYRQSLGRRAAEVARERFSPEREADAVFAAYTEALSKH